MTRKDYIAVAAILRDYVPYHLRANVAHGFVVIFSRDNPRFDAMRFMGACGL